MDPTIALLADLVAIDSVNPSLVPGARGEGDVARRIADECRAAGLTVNISDIAPGRPNVVATLDGKQSGPALMFCGHMDTVGVSGMSGPFEAVERDGRLYGRGAQDMKGGLAAMLGAARQIAAEGLDRGRLIVAAVVDEEHASIGAEALVANWRADVAVVTEPTDLDVAVAHKGFEWIEVETRGVAAHGSRPRDGRDAIMRMGRVLGRLESHDRRLQKRDPHPLLGTASLHASRVVGGREWSSYPERCVLEIERRTLPGERQGVGLQEVDAILDGLRGEDHEFEGNAHAVFGRTAYEVDASQPLPGMLVDAAVAAGCQPARVGMSFWSDAAILSAAGIPTVLFGPGGAGLHSREEYVRVDDVLKCRDTLIGLVRAFAGCGLHSQRTKGRHK
jgi:acetylornithine deacetylase